MGLLDNLERGIEKVVSSAFSAGGSRAVKPVEIASALRHAMDDESYALSEGHTIAPNDFTVHFSAADFERARTWGTTLASELCDEVIRHAQSQGYSLSGTVRVAFHPDDAVRPGRLRVDARVFDVSSSPRAQASVAPTPAPSAPARPTPSPAPRGPVPTPAPPAPTSAPRRATAHAAARAEDEATVVMPRGGSAAAASGPVLSVGGVDHALPAGDAVLGRSPEKADIVVSDSSVSREHARLVRVGGSVTLIDLGSRNGVLVNGVRVDGSTTLRQGDRITVGQTELVFHAADAAGRDRA